MTGAQQEDDKSHHLGILPRSSVSHQIVRREAILNGNLYFRPDPWLTRGGHGLIRIHWALTRVAQLARWGASFHYDARIKVPRLKGAVLLDQQEEAGAPTPTHEQLVSNVKTGGQFESYGGQ